MTLRPVMNPSQYLLAYLGHVLPIISETFVVREIAELRRLGARIKVFSLHPPDDTVIHPEAPDLAREVEVLRQPRNPQFWLAHLFFLLRFPGRYCCTLWRYVLAAPEPWRRRWRYLAYFAVAPFAASRLRRYGVRHLHVHFANAPSSVALLATRLAGISFSFTAHAYDIFVDQQLLPEKLTTAAFVACISRFNLHYLQQRYAAAAGARLRLVRNGVDPQRFSPLIREPALPPTVIGVGRLMETKGFHILVEAMARLRDQGRDVHCIIAGDGPEAERLQRLINEMHLADRISLLGRVQPEDLLAYYRRARVLAMPCCIRNGDLDGIPTVLMEAMAMEIPVVASRVSGIPELVRHDETGLLVDPDDPEALAEALARLLEDQGLSQRLAKAGRDLVVSQFNMHHNVKQLLGLFTEAMASPREPR